MILFQNTLLVENDKILYTLGYSKKSDAGGCSETKTHLFDVWAEGNPTRFLGSAGITAGFRDGFEASAPSGRRAGAENQLWAFLSIRVQGSVCL